MSEKKIYLAEKDKVYNKKEIDNGLFEEVPVTETGAYISTNIVSPVEHEVKCRIERLQILPPNYKGISESDSGITAIVNDDGSVTLNGTATKNSSFTFHGYADWGNRRFPGIITGMNLKLTFIEISGSYTGYISARANKNGNTDFLKSSINTSSVAVVTDDLKWMDTYVYINKDAVFNNYRFAYILSSDIVNNFISPPLYVEDLTAVTVSKYGKNLCDKNSCSTTENSSGSFNIINSSFNKNTELTLSADIAIFSDDNRVGNAMSIVLKYTDGKQKIQTVPTSKEKNGIFNKYSVSIISEKPVSIVRAILFDYMGGSNPHSEAKNIMLTIGKDTFYQKYMKNVYIPDSHGIVSGMNSIYPNMTILTDNSNVMIEATYNADVSKYTEKQPLTPEQMLEADDLKFDRKTYNKETLGELYDEVPVTVSGEVISTNMVSEVEHNVKCKIERKNVFDESKIISSDILVSSGSGKLIIYKSGDSSSIPDGKKSTLVMLCPELKVGDVVTLCGNTTSSIHNYIYLSVDRKFWNYGETIVVTEDILNSIVYWYSENPKPAGTTITEFAIVRGNMAQHYTPYISDLSKVKVNRCGKNLLNHSYKQLAIDSNNGKVYSDVNYISITINTKNIDYLGISGDFTKLNAKRIRSGRFKDIPDKNSITINNKRDDIYNNEVLDCTEANYVLLCFKLNTPGEQQIWNNFMVNDGNYIAEYEPYKGEDFVPNNDGKILNMNSIKDESYMSISSDTPGVNITATYNANTSKYIESNNVLTQEQLKSAHDLEIDRQQEYVDESLVRMVPVTESGTSISTDMVSPVEHEVECRVERINLLAYPYVDSDKTSNGIKWTVSNGVVTAEKVGEVTGDSIFQAGNIKLEPNARYFVTGFPDKNNDYACIVINCSGFGIEYVNGLAIQTSKEFTTTVTFIARAKNINANTFTKLTFYPVIRKTDDSILATRTPYVPDLTAVTVSRYGKNLADWNNAKISTSLASKKQNLSVPAGWYFASALGDAGDWLTPGTHYQLVFKDSANQNVGTGVQYGLQLSEEDAKRVKSIFMIVAGKEYTGKSKTCAFMLKRSKPKDRVNEYEPFSGKSYTPNFDGAISGMISISPNMTILTDNPGAVIETTYGSDVSKYKQVYGNITKELAKESVDFVSSHVVTEATKKYAMPRTEGIDGQFALSDGKGGIRFETFINRSEVGL